MCMYVVFCKIDHCIHIHWCIIMGLGHNDPWVESHMWPQQGVKGQCIHILWCIFKSNITMIAKVCDRESRRDTWFENRLVGWSCHLATGKCVFKKWSKNVTESLTLSCFKLARHLSCPLDMSHSALDAVLQVVSKLLVLGCMIFYEKYYKYLPSCNWCIFDLS